MSQYYVQRSSSLVLVPEEFPLLQWSTTRSSSQSLISTELLEDNTSCSCLEMFASISKLFERIYKPGAFFINALSLTNTLYSGMKNKLSLGFSDTKKIIEKNRRVIDPCGDRHWPLFGHFSHSLLFHFCIFLQASRIRFIGFEGNVQNVEINELCSLRHGFERSLLSCVTWTAVQGLGTFIKKNRQASWGKMSYLIHMTDAGA